MRPINKEIFRIALPSIFANITVPLVGLVDMAVAGHLDAEAALFIGGITIGSMFFDLLYWNFEFLRTGTGGFTAQAFGRNDMRDASHILTRGVVLAVVSALLILLVQVPFTKLASLLVDSSEGVMELALKYFFIRIWAAPVSLSLFAIKGWFIGMQDSVSSMSTDLVVNVVNIVLSIVLAHYIGFAGIPLGTVIAQYSGFIFASVLISVKYGKKVFGEYTLDDFKESVRWSEMRSFVSVNRDLFIRSLSLITIYIGFTVLASRTGDTLLAVSAILMKILMIFSYFTDGFAYSAEALSGKALGSRDRGLLKETVRWTFTWSMGLGVFFVFIYGFGGVAILRMMTSDMSVIEAAKPYIPWLMVMPLLGCPAFTWDGIYTGTTTSDHLRNASFFAAISFFAVWGIGTMILTGMSLSVERFEELSLHLLLLAYFTHLLTRTIYQSALYRPSVLQKLPFGK